VTWLDRISAAWRALRESRAVSVWSNQLSWGGLVSAGQMSNAGILISPDRALSLAAYYAAINRIATDVSSLPLRVYRRRRQGGRDEIVDHPVAELLGTSPDGETTSMRWRQALIGHILGWGNGYAEITFDAAGYPTGLYLLDPSTTIPDRVAQNKRLYYRLGGMEGKATLPPSRVLHCAGFGFDGLRGYSVARLASEAIGLGIAAERFGGSFFGNSVKPSGWLELPYRLQNDEAVKRLSMTWHANYGGVDNTGKVPILEGGAKFHPTSIPPDDAQFLQTRQFQVIEIARLFGIPPHKIGDYSSTGSAYRALEEANTDYQLTTIAPWCRAIEEELNRKLLTTDERKAGFYIEHNQAQIARGNMSTRGEFYSKLASLGVLSPNDIAALEGFNPIGDDGDRRFVSTALVPLDQPTERQPAASPPDVGPTPDGKEAPAPPPESINDDSRHKTNGHTNRIQEVLA